MTKIKWKYSYFAIAWALVFLTQAWWSPPHIDELYYWRFSQDLEWGFFDHPPMVALIIKVSDIIFNGGLAIRGVSVIMTLTSIWLLFKQVNTPEKLTRFWMLIFMLPLFHIYGFITTPDVPLLLFGTAFFYFYKRIIKKGNWTDFVLWGVMMGLMLYSKYHGALLIVFVFISNPRIFLNPKVYVAGALALLIWAPHLGWQYEHNWMTFRFHLMERIEHDFKWYYPLEYIGNLILIFNPLLIGFLFTTLRNQWRNPYERALYFVLIGFIIFFAIQSFNGHVQPQWLILTYIPFIILTHNQIKEKQARLLKHLFWVSIPLMVFIHIAMSFNITKKDNTLFGKELFVERIKQKAGDRPVVFFDSYQDPSLYEWYNPGSLSHTFNTSTERKDQFNIWMQDTMMNGKEVYVFAPDSLNIPDYIFYQSFDKAKVSMEADSTLTIENPYHYALEFSQNQHQILMIFYKHKHVIKQLPIAILEAINIPPQSKTNIDLQVKIPSNIDADKVGFAIKKNPWPGAAVYHRYKI